MPELLGELVHQGERPAGVLANPHHPLTAEHDKVGRAEDVEADEEGALAREAGRRPTKPRLHPVAGRLLGGGEQEHAEALGRALDEGPRDREQRHDSGPVVVRAWRDATPPDVSEDGEPTDRRDHSGLREPPFAGGRSQRDRRRNGSDRAADHGWAGVRALRDQTREATLDRLGDLRIEDQPTVGRVVVGAQHDRTLGVRGTKLGEHRASAGPSEARSAGADPQAAAGHRGRRRRRLPPEPRRASCGREERAAPATSPAAAAIPSGHQNVPWAGSDSIPASIPSRRSSAANHSAASRSPGDALGRWIAQSSSRRRRSQPESRCGRTPAVARLRTRPWRRGTLAA